MCLLFLVISVKYCGIISRIGCSTHPNWTSDCVGTANLKDAEHNHIYSSTTSNYCIFNSLAPPPISLSFFQSFKPVTSRNLFTFLVTLIYMILLSKQSQHHQHHYNKSVSKFHFCKNNFFLQNWNLTTFTAFKVVEFWL